MSQEVVIFKKEIISFRNEGKWGYELNSKVFFL
jgi:hypothetical protein